MTKDTKKIVREELRLINKELGWIGGHVAKIIETIGDEDLQLTLFDNILSISTTKKSEE